MTSQKQSGLTWTVAVDDGTGTAPNGGTARNIEGDVLSFDFTTPRGVQDVTGVNSNAVERLLLLADFTITLNCIYNDTATTGSHAVLSSIPSTTYNRTTTLTHVVTSDVLPNEVVYTDYAFNRAADGSMTVTVPGLLNSTTVPTWA